MTVKPHAPTALDNSLLASLPKADFARLSPHLKPVSMELGHVLYESGDRIASAYFPANSIVSLLYVMENGGTAEIGVVGNDGVIGIALFMGGETMPNRALIQSSGTSFKLDVKVLQEEFARGGAFQRILLRYTQALMTQISQTAVCNRLHTTEQQLCRWLLLSHDRLANDELVMTHDLIANMLGVRREGVTLALQKIAKRGYVKSVRGTITMMDRFGLEEIVCECYKVVNEEYNRLLGMGMARTFRN